MSVRISSKFQVVIPKRVREEMDWQPGTQLDFIRIGDLVHIVETRPIKEMRGVFKGMKNDFVREKKDREL